MRLRFVLVTTATLLMVGTPTAAEANLQVTPTRVVIDSSDQSTTLEVTNTDTVPRTYQIEWRDLRPQDGAASPPGETQRPQDFVRYSPRQVTLSPGESQNVRLLVQAPANLTTGEYRAFMHFAAQPVAAELRADQSGSPSGPQINLNVSMSVPIAIQIGN